MPYEPWPRNGCTWLAARGKTADRDLRRDLAARIEGYKAHQSNVAYRRAIGEADDLDFRDARRLKTSIDELELRVETDFRELLISGRLIAFGRPGSLAAQPQHISADIWPSLYRMRSAPTAVTESRKGGFVFVAVSIYPVIKAPNAATILDGKSFAEAFREAVIDDPEVSTLGRHAVHLRPEYKAILKEGKPYTHGAIAEWPVFGFDCGAGKGSGSDPIGCLADKPPVEAVQDALGALSDRYNALMNLLATGAIEAIGLSMGDRKQTPVQRTIWSHRDFHVNPISGDLYELNKEAVDPPTDRLTKVWTGLLLKAHPPGASQGVVTDLGRRPASRRPRPKFDQVRAALLEAEIDIRSAGKSAKALASQIADRLPYPVKTASQLEALAKMIGRIIREERSKS